MITQDFAERQIKRMGGLDAFPQYTPEAEAEMVITARKCSRSEAHLRGVIDEVVSAWTKCPKPAELRALLDRDRPDCVAPPGCQECSGTGWRVVFKGTQEAAQRCDCARGRWLAGKDGERAQGAV